MSTAEEVVNPKYVVPDSRVPPRKGMTDPNISWRFGGPPEYTIVNKTYLEGKIHNHAPDSLEYIVESIVKTLEMEASHKVDLNDWVSIDPAVFRYTVNGGTSHKPQEIIDRGTYNIFLDRCPIYKEIARDQSEERFKTALPGGFAWEVEKALTGPPTVIFTWRHWTKYDGFYEHYEPTGEVLEMKGTAFATVNDELKLTRLELFFDPNPLLMKLKHVAPGSMASLVVDPRVRTESYSSD